MSKTIKALSWFLAVMVLPFFLGAWRDINGDTINPFNEDALATTPSNMDLLPVVLAQKAKKAKNPKGKDGLDGQEEFQPQLRGKSASLSYDRFTVDKRGVIFDSKTGLEWYVWRHPQDISWKEAKSWTESLSAAGGGWRMPTISELKTLYQPGAIIGGNIDPIFQTTDIWVWSGQLRKSSEAWAFSFSSGREDWPTMGSAHCPRAFAVRSRDGLDGQEEFQPQLRGKSAPLSYSSEIINNKGWRFLTFGMSSSQVKQLISSYGFKIENEYKDIREFVEISANYASFGFQNLYYLMGGDPPKIEWPKIDQIRIVDRNQKPYLARLYFFNDKLYIIYLHVWSGTSIPWLGNDNELNSLLKKRYPKGKINGNKFYYKADDNELGVIYSLDLMYYSPKIYNGIIDKIVQIKTNSEINKKNALKNSLY